MPGKTPFPQDWSPSKIMDVVSDIVTDPTSTIIQDTGIPGTYYTKVGKPAKFYVFGVKDGIKIKIVVMPAGEGIITAHPY
jgi:hypothetical protein